MIARVDENGEIVIPRSWMDELALKPGSEVIIEKKNGKIFVKSNQKIVGKKRIDGFGISKGAKSFKEEEEPHPDLW